MKRHSIRLKIIQLVVVGLLLATSCGFATDAMPEKIAKDKKSLLFEQNKDQKWIKKALDFSGNYMLKYPEDFKNFADTLLKVCSQRGDVAEHVRAIEIKSKVWERIGKHAEAENFLLKSLNSVGKDDFSKYLLCEVLSQYYGACGDLESSGKWLAQMQAIMKKTSDPKVKEKSVTMNYKLGRQYNNIGKYKEALEYYKLALKDASRSKDKKKNFKTAIECRIGLGSIYAQLALYDESVENFNQAINMLKQNVVPKLGMLGYSYSCLGNVYLYKGNPDLAEKYYKLGYEEALEYGDDSMIAATSVDVGNILAMQNKLDSAETIAKVGIEKYLKIGNKTNIVGAYQLLAQIYEVKEEYDLGIKMMLQGNSFSEKTKQLSQQADNAEILANLYFAKKDFANSAKWYRKRLELNREIAEKGEVGQARSDIHKVDIAVKEEEIQEMEREKKIASLEMDKKNAYLFSFILLGVVLLIIIFAVVRMARVRRYAMLEAIKSKEVTEGLYEELSAKQKAIEERDRQLVENDKQKDKLISVIGHDLKNPLAAILSTAELSSTYYDRFSEDRRRGNFQQIRVSASDVVDLLNTLLVWTLNIGKKTELAPETLQASTLLNQVVSSLELNLGNKNLAVEMCGNHNLEIYSDPNTTSTIFRNIMTNAIKFSETGQKITITETEEDKFVRIDFKDEGVGMTAEQLAGISDSSTRKSTKGTASEGGTGLGIGLCLDFAEQNGGKFEITSEGPHKGTCASVWLPKSK